jgi:hypothetical protein
MGGFINNLLHFTTPTNPKSNPSPSLHPAYSAKMADRFDGFPNGKESFFKLVELVLFSDDFKRVADAQRIADIDEAKTYTEGIQLKASCTYICS